MASSTSSSPPPRAQAVLVAAGISSRMGPAFPRKPFLRLDERTILEVSVAAFAAVPGIEEIVLVVHADDVDQVRALVEERASLASVTAVVVGGAERADSVRLGVRAGTKESQVVAIHDAARPLVEPATIARALEIAATDGAALVAVPVRDTVKRSPDGKAVDRTVDRAALWLAQTPQCFRRDRFLALLDRAEAEGFRPTDDAALWERYAGPVPLVEGEATNLKVTTPRDLEIARALLTARNQPRSEP